MLTPVCPRSLSFRPLILPWDVSVALRISSDSRTRRGIISPDGLPSIPVSFFVLCFFVFHFYLYFLPFLKNS